jgi:DNA-binding GntR family transcriptional regulator
MTSRGIQPALRTGLDTDGVPSAGSETRLTQLAYEKIRKAIVYGPLDLGEPLSENDLAKALRMSKAPIRGALTELRLKGLVKVVPQSGTYVFSPGREEIEQLCDFRLLLEERAMRASMQASPRAMLKQLKKVVTAMKKAYRQEDVIQSKLLDTEYHQTFLRHSGNKYLIHSYETIANTVEALRYRFMDTATYRNKAFDEHQEILTVLQLGNVTKAGDILMDHISRTKHFQANINWSNGRLYRKDYKFREYSEIFAD